MPISKDTGYFPKPAVAPKPQTFVAPPPPPPPPPPPVRANWFSDSFSAAPAKSGAGVALLKVDPPWPTGPLGPSKTPSEDVSMMQERLVELGYMTEDTRRGGPGIYGTNTTSAVYDFQLANGILPPTGLADRETLAAMGGSSAVSRQDYLDGLSGETIISPEIGTAGSAPVPTMDTLEEGPLTGTTATGRNTNVRGTPSATGELEGQFASGTTVTIVEPQPAIPEGQDPNWVYVSGTGSDGQPLEGWVANGARVDGTTVDLIDEDERAGDPRVQDRMEAMGYVPPDGAVDAQAISNFQRMNGLEVTGELNDETLSTMWSADAKISTHLRQVTDATYNHSSDAPSKSNNCGPTSVAMALAAAGIKPIDNADPQQAIDDARADTGGTNSTTTGSGDLIDAVEGGGGEAYLINNMDQVQMAVSQGDPVVLFGYRTDYDSDGDLDAHWVTVLGYDAETQTYLVSDPMSRTGVETWTQADMDNYANFTVDQSVAVHNPND